DAGLPCAPRLARSDDHKSGALSINDITLCAIEQEAVAIGARFGSNFVRARFRISQGGCKSAGRDRGQPFGFLRLAATFADHRPGKADRGEEGRAEKARTHLLHQDRDLAPAESEATMRLVDCDALPGKLARNALPESGIVAELGLH